MAAVRVMLIITLLAPGLVEVEEGEVNGQELSIASHSIARISFAKKPHVEQVSALAFDTSTQFAMMNTCPAQHCPRRCWLRRCIE